MPGLLDLPPEVLEQVYDDYDEATDWDDRAQLGYLRLTCRYVEKATRRKSIQNKWECLALSTSEDASLRRFCAMTTASEMAKAVKRIKLFAHDDGTAETETRRLHQQSQTTVTGVAGVPVFPGELRSMKSNALLRHEESLLEALRLCEQFNELRCYEVYYGDMSNHRALPSVSAQKAYPFDMSSTLDFVMSLMVRAGIYLTHVSLVGIKYRGGLTNAAGLVTGKEALRRVEKLELAFIDDFRNDADTTEEA